MMTTFLSEGICYTPDTVGTTQWFHSMQEMLFVVQSLSHVRLFCNPMTCSPPGSSVHGISQARILEWVAISFSRGSSCPRDQIQVSCIAADSLTSEPPGKPHMYSTINIHTAVKTDERSIISNYFSFPPFFLLLSSLSIIKFKILLNKFELIMCPILKTGL